MIVSPTIESYLQSVFPSSDGLLSEMEAEADCRGFPAVGPQVGALLHILVRSLGARRVLELGSGFGYSAVWMGRALPEGGEIHLTDGEAGNLAQARGFLERAGLLAHARFHQGDALQIAGRLEGPFDLVFNDIDKEHYPEAIEPALRLLRPGGLLVTDNALWYGKVADPEASDQATRGVREYNRAVLAHPGLTTSILPLRDGLAISLKH
jgi:predicted O-methyltransferase YrrM